MCILCIRKIYLSEGKFGCVYLTSRGIYLRDASTLRNSWKDMFGAAVKLFLLTCMSQV